MYHYFYKEEKLGIPQHYLPEAYFFNPSDLKFKAFGSMGANFIIGLHHHYPISF